MIKNNLIIIPFNLPWEWSTDYTNQTAYLLSKKNIVICYMWSESFSIKEYLQKLKFPKLIKKHSNNLYLFYPLYVIPFRRFKRVHQLNEFLNVVFLRIFTGIISRIKSTQGKILWNFDPNLRFISNLLGKRWKIIYDCVDYFAAANEGSRYETLRNEKKLVREADLVVANSRVLQRHLKKIRAEIYLVPQGFRVQDFRKKAIDFPRLKVPKPIIGFAGAVNNRLDYNLLNTLAKRNPSWSFVIWGPVLEEEIMPENIKVNKRKLLLLPNVTTGFIKDRAKLPGVFKQFDIAMIPYDISQDFNKYCYPMKLFEFFYLGKPIVSTKIEELKRFPKFVKIGNNVKEWEKIIKELLTVSWSNSYIKEQKTLAINNSWGNKINAISNLYLKYKR